jgi:hypothetical protein
LSFFTFKKKNQKPHHPSFFMSHIHELSWLERAFYNFRTSRFENCDLCYIFDCEREPALVLKDAKGRRVASHEEIRHRKIDLQWLFDFPDPLLRLVVEYSQSDISEVLLSIPFNSSPFLAYIDRQYLRYLIDRRVQSREDPAWRIESFRVLECLTNRLPAEWIYRDLLHCIFLAPSKMLVNGREMSIETFQTQFCQPVPWWNLFSDGTIDMRAKFRFVKREGGSTSSRIEFGGRSVE